MKVHGLVAWVVGMGLWGCASTHPVALSRPLPKQRSALVSLKSGWDRKYVDSQLGFEIARPDGTWQMDVTDELTPEGVSIPIVLREKDSGAQVVIQVAPALVSPSQYAERLTSGLRTHSGFVTSDPEPIGISDNAVGFRFTMGDKVMGRVAVREGTSGHILMMLATWPKTAPETISTRVEEIFGSVRPVPRS